MKRREKWRLPFRLASGIIGGVNAIPPMPTAPAKPLVYLETSFISYLTAPVSSDEAVARRQAATHKWWEEERPKCDVFISDVVVEESKQGNRDRAKARLDVLERIRVVLESDESRALTQVLLAAHALPPNSSTDAAHISIAAVHHADIVLTWNCRHIANPVTLPLTAVTLNNSGYRCPALATPMQLLEARNERPHS